MNYLPIPAADFIPDSVAKFKMLLPDFYSLNSFQQIQYKWMCWMYGQQLEKQAIYKWVAGHEGCFETRTYKGAKGNKPFMKAHNGRNPWTFCTGISLELFFLSWREWMDEDYGSEYDMDPEFIWKVRGHFERWNEPPDQPYYRGAPGGYEILQKHLEERFKKAEDDNNAEMGWIKLFHHTDVEKASFGSVIQFRKSNEKIDGGHAAVLIGVEQRSDYVALRVFNSNYGNALDYNCRQVSPNGGVGATYYKYRKSYNDGSYRESHFGTIIVGEDEYED